jgi:hypothetical protein
MELVPNVRRRGGGGPELPVGFRPEMAGVEGEAVAVGGVLEEGGVVGGLLGED